MVAETKNSPAPASAPLRMKKASSDHARLVKGSCSTRRERSFTRWVCSSVMAKESFTAPDAHPDPAVVGLIRSHASRRSSRTAPKPRAPAQ